MLQSGNLPYDATADDLKKHFAAVQPQSVRIRSDKKTGKSLGFAFIDFKDVTTFRKALAYHHTVFKNRKINVEMTAGGGGGGDKRKQRIQDKQEKLQRLRKKVLKEKKRYESSGGAAVDTSKTQWDD